MGNVKSRVLHPRASRHSKKSSVSQTNLVQRHRSSHLSNGTIDDSSAAAASPVESLTRLSGVTPHVSQTVVSPPSSVNPAIPDLKSLENEIFHILQSREKRSGCLFEEDLDAIWDLNYYRRFYTSRSWYDPSWDKSTLMNGYRKIMSILILVNFNDWDKFRSLFIDRGRGDKDLPFEDLEFLDRFANTFRRQQWAFCPLEIKEQREEQLWEPPRLLPWINAPKEMENQGAFGLVTRGVIAKGYILYDNKTVNVKPKAVAMKRIADQQVDEDEFKNLGELRKCLSGHSRIMVNLATFHNREQKFHYLIYDLAAYDLNVFLTTPIAHMKGKRNEMSSPEKTESKNMWPGSLIKESSCLADALAFLHTRLYNTKRIALAHNDIKPENILVFYPDSNDTVDRFPAGKWKIADFGLSKIKPTHSSGHSKHLSVDSAATRQMEPANRSHRRERSLSFSKSTPKRLPGTYSAPELDQKSREEVDLRKADIWSFGCVLSEVLTYAVELGPDLVQEFRNARTRDCKDPSKVTARFYDESSGTVKPVFATFLSQLPSKAKSSNREWVEQSVKLMQEIVVLDVESRPEAAEIRDKLRKIEEKMSKEKGLWLPQLNTSAASVSGASSPGPSVASTVESPDEITAPIGLGIPNPPDIVVTQHTEGASQERNRSNSYQGMGRVVRDRERSYSAPR